MIELSIRFRHIDCNKDGVDSTDCTRIDEKARVSDEVHDDIGGLDSDKDEKEL